MKIRVKNNANISNKYIRFIKWKLFSLKEKFHYLSYAEVSLKKEGNSPTEYHAKVRLGIPDYDIIIKNKSTNIWGLLYETDRDAYRYLAKNKERLTN